MTSDLQDWNHRIVAEFRSNAGLVRWSTEADLAAGRPVPPLLPGFDPDRGAPILLLGHTGAATGLPRTSPLVYRTVGEAFAVFATFGGSPRDPAWLRNVETNPDVTVEVGTDVMPATARTIDGPERERVWQEQVRLVPAFAGFEEAARRRIPVVVLDPRRLDRPQ